MTAHLAPGPNRQIRGGSGRALPCLRRSVATISLAGTLEEKLMTAARAGFDGVELCESDLIACPLPPAEVRLPL